MSQRHSVRRTTEKVTPERPSGRHLATCLATALVGLALVAVGLFLGVPVVLRALLVLGGLVAFLSGVYLSLGAKRIALSGSGDGKLDARVDMPSGETRTQTIEITEELSEGTDPPKEGRMPPKEGKMPPKEGEMPRRGTSQPPDGTG